MQGLHQISANPCKLQDTFIPQSPSQFYIIDVFEGRLINGFGNLSLLTFSPISIKKSKSKKIVYYSDFFTIATGTIPNQTGIVEEVLGTAGLGLNNSLYLNGDLNKLHFIVKHKIGASYGKYPGLLKIPSQRIVFYQCIQFRIKSVNGALVIDFPLKLTPTNISPFISVGYYQKI